MTYMGEYITNTAFCSSAKGEQRADLNDFKTFGKIH